MQHEHEEWELVAANEVHVVEALKQQGNQLFQQQRYLDAIQVYSRALEKLPDVDHGVVTFMREDVEAFESLEIAVRLNRALAYIELEDQKLLWHGIAEHLRENEWVISREL
ncbi:hypothetical protein Poli38472_006642 [Pythium oligandrum]|uniref:Tetratricopeptide repeat protein n=1 Tax=Pythium oligandrum TaxID=41045 RepID=A0A8K1C4Z7_PYTOL|nr:hypothetical protein Poli38472_006642 [Pythium oligandrum]|eukprot:TMW56632.1 hypothetical protein Poli38472_006642 [Pythium oligandrum]